MKRYSIISLLAMFMFSCAYYNHLPTPSEFPGNQLGATVEVQADGFKKEIRGELIATDSTSLYVLSKGEMIVLESVRLKKLELHNSRTSENPEIVTTWSYLMPLTTITHGFFLILTFPVNAIAGALIADDARNSTYGKIYFKPVPIHEIAKYARFPQGIPEGVIISDIR